MDLSTGKMLWQETYTNPPDYPSLEENISCDVVVFGGGEAGALCSYYLSEQGLDTVLVEKRKIARRSTGANTGLLQFSSDMSLHQMVQVHGHDNAVRFYKLCRTAVDDLESIAGSLGESTEFARRPSLYYASKATDVKHVIDEYHSVPQLSSAWVSCSEIGQKRDGRPVWFSKRSRTCDLRRCRGQSISPRPRFDSPLCAKERAGI